MKRNINQVSSSESRWRFRGWTNDFMSLKLSSVLLQVWQRSRMCPVAPPGGAGSVGDEEEGRWWRGGAAALSSVCRNVFFFFFFVSREKLCWTDCDRIKRGQKADWTWIKDPDPEQEPDPERITGVCLDQDPDHGSGGRTELEEHFPFVSMETGVFAASWALSDRGSICCIDRVLISGMAALLLLLLALSTCGHAKSAFPLRSSYSLYAGGHAHGARAASRHR